MTPAQKTMLTAARIIERNAASLKECSTVTVGKRLRWDSDTVRGIYEGEMEVAAKLREIAGRAA